MSSAAVTAENFPGQLDASRYQVETGRKFDKLITTDRSAVAFIDRATGRMYWAKSWSQRGHMLSVDMVALYKPLYEANR